MGSTWLLLIAAFVAGVVAPVQAGVNSQLRLWAGHPAWAALASFTVGTFSLLLYYVVMRLPWPPVAALLQAPWWSWLGGLLGAYYVASSIVLAPRLGSTVLIALVIAGQLTVSLVLDHFGLIGFPKHSVNPARILGALLLLAGVVLIQRY